MSGWVDDLVYNKMKYIGYVSSPNDVNKNDGAL